MLPPLINIMAGFFLAAPKLKEFGAKEHIETAEAKAAPHMHIIGWVTLVAGVITLLDRIDLIRLFNMFDGDSYPQAIPMILIGAILLIDYFERYPRIHELIVEIEPYKIWIGFWGILAGLVSILFGCPLCF